MGRIASGLAGMAAASAAGCATVPAPVAASPEDCAIIAAAIDAVAQDRPDLKHIRTRLYGATSGEPGRPLPAGAAVRPATRFDACPGLAARAAEGGWRLETPSYFRHGAPQRKPALDWFSRLAVAGDTAVTDYQWNIPARVTLQRQPDGTWRAVSVEAYIIV